MNSLYFARVKGMITNIKMMLLLTLICFSAVGAGQSISLNGSNQYAKPGEHASLKLTDFTLEAWIKIEGTGVTASSGTGGITVVPVISKGRGEAEAAAKDVNYMLGYDPATNKLSADFEDNATSGNHPVTSTGTIGNCWTHVAASYNTSTDTWKLYINGALDKTLALGGNFTPQSLSTVEASIGTTLNSTGATGGFFNGRIDEVRIWNVVRSDAEIMANYNAELTTGTGLAARWGFIEGSGAVAANSIGGGPSAALINTPLWETGFNQNNPNGTALDFNGSSDYVSFGAAPGLNTSTFTLEAWIMIEGSGATTTTSGAGGGGLEGATSAVPIVTKGRGEAESPDNINMSYFMGLVGNKLAADFEESSGPNHSIISNATIPSNTWTHIAATYEPVTAEWNLYINGALDKTADIGSNINPVSTSIQHAAVGTALNSTGAAQGFFDGKIDEVRIWNVARSATEIADNYTKELTGGTGLLGRWSFNESCGLTAGNTVSGGVDGTLSSSTGPLWVSPGPPFNQNNAVTEILQDGVNSYTGTRDTYTYDVDPATVRGEELTFIQDINTGDERRSLLSFDLSSIPAGSTVQSAELDLNVDTEGQGFKMHRMLTSWDEAALSFASNGNRHFAADNTDAESAIDATWPGVDTYTGPITVAISAATIQAWIDGTMPNNGWLMIATDQEDGQQISSRESSTISIRPALHITYTAAPNLAPAVPVNPSPADNATAPTTSPTLCATVSDPERDNLQVRFYGRKKATANNKFTIIGLPDTQFYTEEPQGQNSSGGGHNGIFKAQTQWIADHRIDSSIAFVIQLGDCVQNGDNPPGADKELEWKRADTAIKKIENPNVPLTYGIPYGICVGNHDQYPKDNPDAASAFYNQYFGETRFTGRAYYGGHYGANNDNHYELFSAGGIDFINISIEYYPDGTTASLQPVLDWADALLKTYSNRKGIISTHNMLTTGNPASFQGPGQKIYNDLKDNPNLILMLCGHVSGEGRRTDVYNGNTVHSILADYQSGYTNGGNGYLRIMQFLPDQNLLNVKTYSPYANTSLNGASSSFTLPVNLSQDFTLIGTNNNVTSGTISCTQWSGLDQSTEYEWYVEVSDGVNTTTGPIWTFTTPANGPLPVNLIQFDAQPENNNKVKISWTTTYERDNNHFEIERSKDGVHFTTIASVTGLNNSNSLRSYSNYDYQPLQGISYYRLKQVDTDNRFSFSKTVQINLSKPSLAVEIFPNPVAGNNFSVRIPGYNNTSLDVKIYDMKGGLLFSKQYPGSELLNVSHHFVPGIYTIKVSSGEGTVTKKFVVK